MVKSYKSHEFIAVSTLSHHHHRQQHSHPSHEPFCIS